MSQRSSIQNKKIRIITGASSPRPIMQYPKTTNLEDSKTLGVCQFSNENDLLIKQEKFKMNINGETNIIRLAKLQRLQTPEHSAIVKSHSPNRGNHIQFLDENRPHDTTSNSKNNFKAKIKVGLGQMDSLLKKTNAIENPRKSSHLKSRHNSNDKKAIKKKILSTTKATIDPNDRSFGDIHMNPGF